MSNKQLLTNLIDKSEELDLFIIRLSLLEQSDRIYGHNPEIYGVELTKERYNQSMNKIKSMIAIEKKEKVNSKRHPLSDVPGGSTLTIVKNDGSVLTMTNVKFPKKYTDAVLNNKQNEIKSICDERGHYWHIKY